MESSIVVAMVRRQQNPNDERPVTPTLLRAEDLTEHLPAMLRLARSLVESEQAAEDLVQDLFVNVLRKPPTVRSNLGGWMRIVLTRKAKRRAWTERNRRLREEDQASLQPQEPNGNASVAIERNEDALILAQAVQGLREPYRGVIQLRYYHSASIQQIASELNRPIATVKSQLARGLTNLQASLDAHYGDRKTWLGSVFFLQASQGLKPAQLFSTRWTGIAASAAILAGVAVVIGSLPTGNNNVQTPSEGLRVASRLDSALDPQAGQRRPVPTNALVESNPASQALLQVIDDQGNGVAQATVWGVVDRSKFELGRTDSEGLLFADPAQFETRKSLRLRIEAEGFAALQTSEPFTPFVSAVQEQFPIEGIALGEENREPSMDVKQDSQNSIRSIPILILSPQHTSLQLTVLTSRGQPAANCKALLTVYPDSGSKRFHPTVSAITDSAGHTVFQGLAIGSFNLSLKGHGSPNLQTTGLLRATTQHLRVQLQPGVTVRGTVRDPKGQALSGVQVSVDALDPRSRLRTKSAKDGSFRLGPLGLGQHRLWAATQESLDGSYGVDSIVLDLISASPATWNPQLTETQPWTLAFQDERGSPIPQRRVVLRQASSHSSAAGPTWRELLKTNDHGEVQLARIPPGSIELLVEGAEFHQLAAQHFEFHPDEFADEHISKLPEPIVVRSDSARQALSGRLELPSYAELGASAGHLLVLHPKTHRIALAPIEPVSGEFRAEDIPEGSYDLFWKHPRLGLAALGQFELPQGQGDVGVLPLPSIGWLELSQLSNSGTQDLCVVLDLGIPWSPSAWKLLHAGDLRQRLALLPGSYQVTGSMNGSLVKQAIQVHSTKTVQARPADKASE